jgi:FAD/FMN-containing dehydrogenase
MSKLEFVSGSGAKVGVEVTKVDELRSHLSGAIILEGDGGYDEARTIWNAMIDRRPALIAMCTDADDVVACVNFARKHGVLVAIHGGGHNIAGNGVCDGGFMINLSQMTDIEVDTTAKRALVGPGATLGDVDAATLKHGLAVPVGINSTTGIAGLTLGGGFGWLSRKHGLTADNLAAADMVTADGKKLRVSDSDNPDLFWAIRGGGGNFGVVTRFEYNMQEAGPDMLSGLIVYPFSEAKSILMQYRDFAANAPEELSVWVVMRQAPPLPFLPESVHGKEVVVLALCYNGDPAQGEKIIEPLRGFGNPHGEHVGVQPFADWQAAFDPLLTPGARNYWKSHNFAELTDDAFDVMIEYAGKLPSPQCEIFIAHIEGATTRVPADAIAYSHRDANFVLNVHGRWDDASDDSTCVTWARSFFKASEPFATGGVYINFMAEDETDRVRAGYGGNYDKLAAIKKKYDADNLFRLNQNINPES